MFVVATAGHVDHGKSTLVRSLTGMEPDRWAEERRRGLTIDLGFAWTALPSGRDVAFVDVPGHERFLGNMLAGLGPVPVVCFVVAADEGWQAQSSDHRDALAALGIQHGLLVVTCCDRAPERVEQTIAQAREELADTGLHDAPVVAVSAVTGDRLEQLRRTLDDVLAALPVAPGGGRVRLWIDRSFSITGAGTVVTGTLPSGSITVGDRLQLLTDSGPHDAVVRGLESCGLQQQRVSPVSRVAVNLRGVASPSVRRGDVLVTPDAWIPTRTLDVRRTTGVSFEDAPTYLTLHAGTIAVPARLRPFGPEHGRLTVERSLPLVLGDRVVLRNPGSRRVLAGAMVLDADPPQLRQRGAARRRTEALTGLNPHGDALAEVVRRGAVTVAHLRQLGIPVDGSPPSGVLVIDDWWVHQATFVIWRQRLRVAVTERHGADPLAGGLSRGAAGGLLGLPDPALLDPVARAEGLELDGGLVRLAGSRDDLGAAEASVAELERRLGAHPFQAPEADDLAALALNVRVLAAAERSGRVLRLRDGVVLLPSAPALAMRELARLDQPFTTSAARQALGTTRRTAIPLLEHLDGRGWTRRLDAGHREVVRSRRPAG
ncbi:selenocysteine-specific translation elongation factor [Leekyejoonella antrihumi]|uniref:Selenocysteine-specific translation elongation factor n=1 Tax=Leekyejoonella antrihumi TaxID=1660198 RepID=A0A563E351_9MICO|nr:selenocysteine-specific translation elongation factor [Leekyejoonella antrihumi]TWP36632.1 selenocysteine-specific translation elongation factor [Leekyejoonella antrihumi]